MNKTALSSFHLESCIAGLVAIQLDRGRHPVSNEALLALQDHYRPVGQVEEEPAVVLNHIDIGKEMTGFLGTDKLAVVGLHGDGAVVLPDQLERGLLGSSCLTSLDTTSRLDAEVPEGWETFENAVLGMKTGLRFISISASDYLINTQSWFFHTCPEESWSSTWQHQLGTPAGKSRCRWSRLGLRSRPSLWCLFSLSFISLATYAAGDKSLIANGLEAGLGLRILERELLWLGHCVGPGAGLLTM